MGKCKNCKFWEWHEDMYGKKWATCGYADWVDKDSKIPDNGMAYYADANDDTNLEGGIITGPNFGCTKFERDNTASIGGISLEISEEQARSVVLSGTYSYLYLVELLKDPKITSQIEKLPPKQIAAVLDECGVWNQDQLQDDYENRIRLLWIACRNRVDR